MDMHKQSAIAEKILQMVFSNIRRAKIMEIERGKLRGKLTRQDSDRTIEDPEARYRKRKKLVSDIIHLIEHNNVANVE